MSDKDSLEEIAQRLSKNLPKFIDLRTFEKRTLKIIRSKYQSDAEYKSIGGHSNSRKVQFDDGAGEPRALRICKRQKGAETFISPGVFKEQVQHLSKIINIPYAFLEVYIKGSGKLYKKYIKKLEKEYEI
ncbi:hypothetical protein KY333_03380 [Candidatus Woesearchaeota archaeon]|nr:hypothetical protein [Candidatus Woesearchaeota archaeon]